MKKKSVSVVAVALFATGIFGIEPSDLVRFYRDSFTNDVASRELTELLTKNRNLLSELKSRMNGVELLLMYGIIDTFSVTSTELTLTFRASLCSVDYNGTRRGTTEYAENNEALILTSDQGANISDGYHSSLIFTPVSFKDKRKGFRIINQAILIPFGGGVKHWFGYIALSDTPVEVGEDDVEMILEGGEWVKFEGNKDWETALTWAPPVEEKGEAQETPPIIEDPVTVTQDETPANVAENESSEGKSKATTFWLYAIIPLCLLAGLWVVRKKRKRNPEN